jgi:hypothetical protein
MELGLQSPLMVVGSADLTSLQLLALMNRLGESLVSEYEWQNLQKENLLMTEGQVLLGNVIEGNALITSPTSAFGSITGNFTYAVSGDGLMNDSRVVSATANTVVLDKPAQDTFTSKSYTFTKIAYDMPADFHRSIDDTQWDKSGGWMVQGAKRPQEWQALKSGPGASGTRLKYRILGDRFNVFPVPTIGTLIGFEYVSTNWVSDISGVGKTRMNADSDTCVFPDRLMVMGVKLLFWQTKGFDSTIFERDFQKELSKFKAMQAGGEILNLATRRAVDSPQIQDGNFPG